MAREAGVIPASIPIPTHRRRPCPASRAFSSTGWGLSCLPVASPVGRHRAAETASSSFPPSSFSSRSSGPRTDAGRPGKVSDWDGWRVSSASRSNSIGWPSSRLWARWCSRFILVCPGERSDRSPPRWEDPASCWRKNPMSASRSPMPPFSPFSNGSGAGFSPASGGTDWESHSMMFRWSPRRRISSAYAGSPCWSSGSAAWWRWTSGGASWQAAGRRGTREATGPAGATRWRGI